MVSQIIDVQLWWEGNGLYFVLYHPTPPLQRQMKLFSSHTIAKTNMESEGYFLCVFLRDISFDSKGERKMF